MVAQYCKLVESRSLNHWMQTKWPKDEDLFMRTEVPVYQITVAFGMLTVEESYARTKHLPDTFKFRSVVELMLLHCRNCET